VMVAERSPRTRAIPAHLWQSTGVASPAMPRAVPFVGRKPELDALAARFDEGTRLVTLLGPGGIGKTALAVEHALRRVEAGARTSVVFCDLSGARDPASILDAVALACDADAGGIGAALATRGEVILVLDNFDGLTEHALATVGTWVDEAPEADVLVTSRERLAMLGEVVLEVGPLADAVTLLVAAAAKGGGALVLPPADRAAATEIVALLEGVPLAVEIAGARLPLLGALPLLERLRASTEGLRREARGGPARHASLDAAVHGSFEGLQPHERDVLAQLAVFHGGFTVASAEAVVEVRGGGPVLEAIATLRARSLVRTREVAAARFDLYASIRSFVVREHPGPIAAASERHAAWFVSEAERAAEQAHRDVAAAAWLIAERENVLAVATKVLSGAPVTARTAEPALRALVALSPVLLAQGTLGSVAALLAPVVERTRDSGADPRLASRALLLRGAMRRDRGDVRAALKDLLGAESIARALGDALLGADLRIELGRTLLVAGEVAAAAEHFARAEEAFAALGARAREAHALAWRAVAAVTARDGAAGAVTAKDSAGGGAARAWLERSVALAAGDFAARAVYLVLLGRACGDAGESAAARRALVEAGAGGNGRVGLTKGTPSAATAAIADRLLGMVLHDAGETDAAVAALECARDSLAALGLPVEAAIARGQLGWIALERGRAAEGYALIADARDVAIRAGRTEDAAYFGDAGASQGARVRGLLEGWAPGALHARVRARAGGVGADAGVVEHDAVVVGTDGMWFRVPQGPRVGLERRRSLALLLDRLARERIERPSATLAAAALFAAAWPGEKAIASAAAHRVRVAVATLRKLGLRDAIVTLEGGGGYALAAELRVVRG